MQERRRGTLENLVHDHVQALLSIIFELVHYALHLQNAPMSACALAVDGCTAPELETQKQILSSLQAEWRMVLGLEAQARWNDFLAKNALYTHFMHYREILTCLEQNKWKINSETKSLIMAWHPAFNASANVESLFQSMEEAAKRASKHEKASLPNLQCLTVRALQKKILREEDADEPGRAPCGISLSSEDWEGAEVRALKSSIWRPDSYSGSTVLKFKTYASSCLVSFRILNIDCIRCLKLRQSFQARRCTQAVPQHDSVPPHQGLPQHHEGFTPCAKATCLICTAAFVYPCML